MSGYPILPLLAEGADPLPEIVDCGNCPVSIACAVGTGSIGWTFACCHTTVIEIDNTNPGELLVVDCTRHHFKNNQQGTGLDACPLCSGDVVETECRTGFPPVRWLPTVHALVTANQRIELWKKRLPVVNERLADEELRKRKG